MLFNQALACHFRECFVCSQENSSFNVHPLNSYLRQHQQRMEFFLEGVSTSPQGTHDTIHKVGGYCDVAEKFASIHRICCDNYEALRKRSISYVSQQSNTRFEFVVQTQAQWLLPCKKHDLETIGSSGNHSIRYVKAYVKRSKDRVF